MSTMQDLAQMVLAGSEAGVKEKVKLLLEQGTDPREIISEGLIAGMNIVAPLFKNGEMFVPEVLVSARAMKAGMVMVKPLIADADALKAGKVVIGTVKGDLHDIGKNLVSMMLESAGFEVVDLGVDIAPAGFAQAIRAEQPDIVAFSALLTSTMPAIEETFKVLEQEGLRANRKFIVGGAPVTQEFADQIGADGFAPDGASAAELCRELLA